MKLLLVEDDPKVVAYLTRGLSEEGFVVESCSDGEVALDIATSDDHDLIILDVLLPMMNGWTFLKRFRQQDQQTPIVMLTARDAVDDRVRGLTFGADDYLVKPFAFAELLARVLAVLRRRSSSGSEQNRFDDLFVDTRRHKVVRGNTPIDLSAREIMVLDLLVRHQGQVLSRTYIAEQVWDMNFDGDSNIVDVNIRRLRSKIDDPFFRKLIHTVRGRGYVMR